MWRVWRNVPPPAVNTSAKDAHMELRRIKNHHFEQIYILKFQNFLNEIELHK